MTNLIKRELDKAKRAANAALRLAQEVPWKDEHRELLSHSVGQVRPVLDQLEAALKETES